jgi:hypothetical protein
MVTIGNVLRKCKIQDRRLHLNAWKRIWNWT